jgi:hypothetical protein
MPKRLVAEENSDRIRGMPRVTQDLLTVSYWSKMSRNRGRPATSRIETILNLEIIMPVEWLALSQIDEL